MPKYLLVFEKGESVRWLSHLDIHRTFERAIRRAGLPIAFSAGFNPRERLSFVSALGTGITGANELMVLELTEPLALDAIRTQLNGVFPSGIQVLESHEIPDTAVKLLPKEIDRAEYRVVCACTKETSSETIQEAICNLLAQDEIMIARERDGRTRHANIRPFLFALHLLPERESDTRILLSMILGQSESGTARPQEIVTALQLATPDLTLRRSQRVCMMTIQGKYQLSLSPLAPL